MSAAASIAGVRRAVRGRLAASTLVESLCAAALAAALPLAGLPRAGLALLLALLVLALRLPALRRHDTAWVVRQLDARLPELEDSTALLLDDAGAGSAMQRLQRARVEARFAAASLPSLQPRWPWQRWLGWLLAAALLAGGVRWWPSLQTTPNDTKQRTAEAAAAAGASAVAQDWQVRVEPPAYTGLPARTETAPELRVPAGSLLRWTLRLPAATREAALRLEDGSTLDLQRSGGDWKGGRAFETSQLYRLLVDGREDVLHRVEVVPDAPPQIELRKPERSLNEVDEAPKAWALEFVARDDYGLGAAELQIQRTEGDGENIKVQTQTRAIEGSGDARERHYRVDLDVAALGLTRGQDLIVRLRVSDNRQPKPNQALGPAVLLRWTAEAAKEGGGVEGLVKQSAPAYFRSERQLIIDTEALLAQRGSLSEQAFAARGDELGVDQKMLRLRYGQFLGEEFEGEGEHAPAGSTAPKNPNEAGEKEPARAFGSGAGIEAEYGHVHDVPEAATLLDEGTKKLLRNALNAMWQAELQLRSAQPEAALPHEHTALEAIKQVQQATRVYLARSGLQLPEPDPARRLSGKRDGLVDAQLANSSDDADAPARAAWQALARDAAPDWDALDAWAAQRKDAAALRTLVDAARRDPACADCRERLRAQLWPLLPPPAAGVAPRSTGSGWLRDTR